MKATQEVKVDHVCEAIRDCVKERDTYRDLCVELVSFAKIRLKSMTESVLLMSAIAGNKTTEQTIIERSTKDSPIGKLNLLINKAEQLLGEKN